MKAPFPAFPLSCRDARDGEKATVRRGRVAHQFRRVLRRFLKQIIRDAFQVVGGFFRPAQLHLAAGLLFSNQLFKPRADFFVSQKLTPSADAKPFSTSRMNHSS